MAYKLDLLSDAQKVDLFKTLQMDKFIDPSIKVKKTPKGKEYLDKAQVQMLKKGIIKVANTPSNKANSDAVDTWFQDNLGIVLDHVYTILDAKVAKDGTRWVKMRNPWKDTTQTFAKTPPFNPGPMDGGTFWLNYKDFKKWYVDLELGT